MAKVLIVDDEQILTDAYELVLSKDGHKVFVANRPKDGLDIAEKEHPDILLLDMLMPDMNGIEFLKALKAKKIKIQSVLGFSNIENEEVVSAAKKLGVKDYLLKVNYTPRQVAELVIKLTK